MKVDYTVSVYLDTRRAKSDGKYPIKLRVYQPSIQKKKLYPTNWDLTEKEFNDSYNNPRPKGESNKELKREIEALRVKADEVAKEIVPFDFNVFEKRLYRKAGDGIKLHYQFKEQISALKKDKRLGSASTYELSEKSISEYSEQVHNRKYSKLAFSEITPEWLKGFEKYMTESKDRSITTVGIYLRSFRAVFNRAREEEKELLRDIYPFGKYKYEIPAPRNTKKALNKKQLGDLFNGKPKTSEQQKAKDFWFFSYCCNGMNVKDIANLKYKNLNRDALEFRRAKTKNTKKNQQPITAYLNEFTKDVIKKYGKKNQAPDNLVFDIIDERSTPELQRKQVQNFTRKVNQHFLKYAQSLDINEPISTYWARHSFSSLAVNNGASMEFVSEALGHSNLKTTQNYFAGFENDKKKEIAKGIINFD